MRRTIKQLDIDAILKDNPRVDRDEVRRRRNNLPMPEPMEGNPVSPYGRKRATPDDKMNWTEVGSRRAR